MEVVTFLTKIQKSEGNSTTLKNWIQKLEGKPTTLKNWIQKMEGNSTTPKNCVLTNFLNKRSTIFFLVFSLIRFWIFVRNDNWLQGISAIRDFRIRDPHYFVIQFRPDTKFVNSPPFHHFQKKKNQNQKLFSQFYKRLISIFCCCLLSLIWILRFSG